MSKDSQPPERLLRKENLEEFRIWLKEQREKNYQDRIKIPLSTDEVRCSRCTSHFPSYYIFCGHCGNKLSESNRTIFSQKYQVERQLLDNEAKELGYPIPEYQRCSECYIDYEKNFFFCPQCGKQTDKTKKKIIWDDEYRCFK